MKRAALLLFALAALTASADTLTLRDGTAVNGKWLSIDADQISFLVNGEVKSYARAQVSKVTFGEAPKPASPEPAAAPPKATSSGPSGSSPSPAN